MSYCAIYSSHYIWKWIQTKFGYNKLLIHEWVYIFLLKYTLHAQYRVTAMDLDQVLGKKPFSLIRWYVLLLLYCKAKFQFPAIHMIWHNSVLLDVWWYAEVRTPILILSTFSYRIGCENFYFCTLGYFMICPFILWISFKIYSLTRLHLIISSAAC